MAAEILAMVLLVGIAMGVGAAVLVCMPSPRNPTVVGHRAPLTFEIGGDDDTDEENGGYVESSM